MTNFNLDTARLLIDMSVEVYKEQEDIDLSEHDFDLDYFFDDQDSGTQAMIATHAGEMVISFRGTDGSFADIITDFQISFEHYPNVGWWFWRTKVHKGFLSAYRTVKNDMMIAINKLLAETNYKIYVTGHSLGGALATLMGLDMSKHYNQEIEVYTYGSPMVGNRWFKRHYNDKVETSFRIENDDDIIPHFPGGAYHHVETYVLLNNEEEILINPSLEEQITKKIEGWAGTIREGVDEHRGPFYRELLHKIDKVVVDS